MCMHYNETESCCAGDIAVSRIGDMMYEGHSRSNITQQSSKGSLFTSFEDVEVTIVIAIITT